LSGLDHSNFDELWPLPVAITALKLTEMA